MNTKEVLRELNEVYEGTSSPDWDGYEAEPVTEDNYQAAITFLKALPEDFPAPEIAADPDGEISLEWYTDKTKTFSVSIGRDTLTYAGLLGPEQPHGTEPFKGEIPEVILQYIRRFK